MVVYRDARGTFTRSVTFTFVAAVIIMLLVRGQTTHAVPFYSIGVFLPITAMGLAIRRHVLTHATGRARRWGDFRRGAVGGRLPRPDLRQVVRGRLDPADHFRHVVHAGPPGAVVAGWASGAGSGSPDRAG